MGKEEEEDFHTRPLRIWHDVELIWRKKINSKKKKDGKKKLIL